MRSHENLEQFSGNTLRTDDSEQTSVALDCIQCHRLDLKVQLSREADGAEHAQRILSEAHVGVADAANGALSDVLVPVDVIDDSVFVEHAVVVLQQQSIHREVTTHHVFSGGLAVSNRLRATTGSVHAVSAVGRNLNLHVIHDDNHDAELRADWNGVPEDRTPLFRQSVGRDVNVLGVATEDSVAHVSADEECLEALFFEPVHYLVVRCDFECRISHFAWSPELTFLRLEITPTLLSRRRAVGRRPLVSRTSNVRKALHHPSLPRSGSCSR